MRLSLTSLTIGCMVGATVMFVIMVKFPIREECPECPQCRPCDFGLCSSLFGNEFKQEYDAHYKRLREAQLDNDIRPSDVTKHVKQRPTRPTRPPTTLPPTTSTTTTTKKPTARITTKARPYTCEYTGEHAALNLSITQPFMRVDPQPFNYTMYVYPAKDDIWISKSFYKEQGNNHFELYLQGIFFDLFPT